MNNVIQDIDSITDSREMMDAKPHPFTSILIYGLLTLILSALAWSYFGEKEIVIKTNGVLRPNTDVVRIINKTTGTVVSTNIKEGQKVKAGDILYELDHSDLDLQKSLFQEQLDKKNKEILNLQKLKQCIIDNKNYFSDTSLDEKDYYNKFIKYQSDYQDIQNQSNVTSTQIQGEINTQQVELISVQNTLNNLNLFQKSINESKNYLSVESSYYYQYEDYKINVDRYQSKINQFEQNYNSLKEQSNIPQDQLDAAKADLDNAKNDLDKYKNQVTINILSDIEQNQNKKKSLQATMDSNNNVLNQNSNTVSSSLNKYKYTTLTQIDDSIKVNNDEVLELTSSLKNLDMNIDNCIIKAPIDGIITINTQINKEDFINTGTDLASIIPDDNSQYKVDLTIDSVKLL